MQCINPLFSFAVPYREDGILKRRMFFTAIDMLRSLEYKQCHVFTLYELPCGKCLCCRENRAKDWAIRLKCESYLHDVTSFVTLTYDDDHLPKGGNLNYRDVQLFLKRLRKSLNFKVRFFCAGEYGSSTLRPHYHLIVYNYYPNDSQPFSESGGNSLYTSESLTALWKLGHAVFSRATIGTMLYTARYSVKKIADNLDSEKKALNLVPEFCRMSTKPGIGYDFLKRFGDDLKGGYIVDDNIRYSIPRYLKNKLLEFDPSFQSIIDRNANYAKLATINHIRNVKVAKDNEKDLIKFYGSSIYHPEKIRIIRDMLNDVVKSKYDLYHSKRDIEL